MSYARNFLRITWQFIIAGTDEVADTSLNISQESGSYDAAQAVATIDTSDLEALRDAYAAMVVFSGAINWADYSTMVGVKAAALDTAGHYIGDPVVLAVSAVTGGVNNIAPEQTVVLSLNAAADVGQGVRGRMYLPHTKVGQQSGTPYMSTTAQNAALALGVTFLQAVNSTVADLTVSGTGRIVVASKIGAGTMKYVTRARMGRVVDTQRRRRNRLDEAYVEGTL